jgi:hypothetical protein
MTEVLADLGEFEIKTEASEVQQTDGDIDYSLLERRVEESLEHLGPATVLLLREASQSPNPTVRGIGLNSVPEALLRGVETGALDDADMDELRNVWLAEMCSKDEDRKYLAQELFEIDKRRLYLQDHTTYIWLVRHVVSDWFDG